MLLLLRKIQTSSHSIYSSRLKQVLLIKLQELLRLFFPNSFFTSRFYNFPNCPLAQQFPALPMLPVLPRCIDKPVPFLAGKFHFLDDTLVKTIRSPTPVITFQAVQYLQSLRHILQFNYLTMYNPLTRLYRRVPKADHAVCPWFFPRRYS